MSPEHVIDDRDDVGEALTRAGAGGQDVAGTSSSRLDRIRLVAVEAEGFLGPLGLAELEYPPRLLVEHAVCNELVDPFAG
jgi:hypothetical protein